jgi:hypothetical protein
MEEVEGINDTVQETIEQTVVERITRKRRSAALNSQNTPETTLFRKRIKVEPPVEGETECK